MKEILQNLDWSVLTGAAMNLIPAVICIMLHELSHGWAALALGDTTAKDRGRLSLNPLRHIDWMGLVMIAVFHFGWAKPVPVDMRRFRDPKRGMAITAAAGPLMNVLIACVGFFFAGMLSVFAGDGILWKYGIQLLSITANLSISLAVFNLIPIPPLDGSKVLLSILPERAYGKLMQWEKYGMILLVVLVVTGILSRPLSAAVRFCVNGLLYFARWGAGLAAILTAGV